MQTPRLSTSRFPSGSDLRRPALRGVGSVQAQGKSSGLQSSAGQIGATGGASGSPSKLHTKTCQNCGGTFKTSRSHAKWCSHACRQDNYELRQRYEEFFTKRGLGDGRREQMRPGGYRLYSAAKRDPDHPKRIDKSRHGTYAHVIDQAFREADPEGFDSKLRKDQRRTYKQQASQGDGFVMMKHPVPGLGLPPIPPQVRPFKGELDEDGREKKYLNAVSPKRKIFWTDNHYMRFFKDWKRLSKEQKRKRMKKLGRHLDAKPPYGHRGEQPFPPKTDHVHPKLVRDWSEVSDAMRFEHTQIQTVDDWRNADIIFVGIEGTPKCDAMAADLRALGLNAVACSVPACWMWGDSGVMVNGVRELDLIANAYMQGKLVIVVPDDDWAEKKKNGDYPVRTAAYLLQERLLDLDLDIDARIYAPKSLPGFDKTGIDDSIAAGCHLTDLLGLERQSPDLLSLRLWLKSKNPGASDTRTTNLARAYWGLAMHAVDDDGNLRLPGRRMLARIMGCSPSMVLPYLNALWLDYGAIKSDKPLEMEVKYEAPLRTGQEARMIAPR
jgi:hypothetical protein